MITSYFECDEIFGLEITEMHYYPFTTGQKTRLNPLTIGFWWQWERRIDPRQTTQQATRVKIAFNRLGSDWHSVGTPDQGQPASLRDDIGRYVTYHNIAAVASYIISRATTKLVFSRHNKTLLWRK